LSRNASPASSYSPRRKIFYNLTTISLSIAVALVIGTIELAQVVIAMLGLQGRAADFLAALDCGKLGYIIVGMFLLAWGLSVGLWKFGRIEQRYCIKYDLHSHPHRHDEGVEHSHKHLHKH
jgi:nickel/cobalt transporter (NiCoT) family protein